MSYTLFVCADPQGSFQIPLFATFPSRLCRSQIEGPMRVPLVRHLRHFYPVAGLRHWISQKFPFLDGNGDLNDSKRSLYDSAKQNRWKNAINQIGTGTGLTEDEKAEAARIRRAKLVAQDPQYTQRLFGSSTSAGNNRQAQPVCTHFRFPPYFHSTISFLHVVPLIQSALSSACRFTVTGEDAASNRALATQDTIEARETITSGG
jgi:hypothetical protein